MPGESITFLYKFAMEHEIGIVTYEDENIITETPENEYVLEEQKINKMTIKKSRFLLRLCKISCDKVFDGRRWRYIGKH